MARSRRGAITLRRSAHTVVNPPHAFQLVPLNRLSCMQAIRSVNPLALRTRSGVFARLDRQVAKLQTDYRTGEDRKAESCSTIPVLPGVYQYDTGLVLISGPRGRLTWHDDLAFSRRAVPSSSARIAASTCASSIVFRTTPCSVGPFPDRAARRAWCEHSQNVTLFEIRLPRDVQWLTYSTCSSRACSSWFAVTRLSAFSLGLISVRLTPCFHSFLSPVPWGQRKLFDRPQSRTLRRRPVCRSPVVAFGRLILAPVRPDVVNISDSTGASAS